MITRIELTNFMSHAKTVIEPAAGLTVLVGPNNVGKSAIVAALQILCHNENSTYVMRHGARECSISVQTDDGHVIEWRRKNSPSYVIDGQVFDRLRTGGRPEDLHRVLRLPKVDATNDGDFDVHFGTQKSPIFLLESSGAVAARFFASSSDAIRLVAILKRHKEKLSDAQREKQRLELESRQLNSELEFLEPIVEINDRLQTVEKTCTELLRLATWLDELKADAAALAEDAAIVMQFSVYANVLSPLATPPHLQPLVPLEKLITLLEDVELNMDSSTSRVCVLSTMSPPPEMAAVHLIDELIVELESAQKKETAATLAAGVLSGLLIPPSLHDLTPLYHVTEDLVWQFQTVERETESCQKLLPLSSPPLLVDTETLRRLTEQLAMSAGELGQADARTSILQLIATPPRLDDETALRGLLTALVRSVEQVACWQTQMSILSLVTTPAIPTDTESLAVFATQLEDAIRHEQNCAKDVEMAIAELELATEELRDQAARSLCRLCGSSLDPDQVIARTLAGLGVHDHER